LMGYVRLMNVIALKNGGNGARVRFLSGPQYHWPEETPELVHQAQWLCRPGAIPASPVFPFLVVAEIPVATFQSVGECELIVSSDQPGQVLTITLFEILYDPMATGYLELWDMLSDERIALWAINNRTIGDDGQRTHRVLRVNSAQLYQGVSSVKNTVRIRFAWQKNPDQAICSQFAGCLRAVMQIGVGDTLLPELHVEESAFVDNMQHGLLVERPWSYVRIVRSDFVGNQYAAGLKVVNGSADLFVHNCTFAENEQTGLNVSTIGGFKQINQSVFDGNRGHGLSVWNPDTATERRSNEPIRVHVHTTEFHENWWDGIQFYNSCSDMHILVNFSTFKRNGASGIRTYSCVYGEKEV
uniref:Beta_helix domain-containing protein n=1 Tax=Echinostoma caproni TaxID=27848 RepID=A0A183AVF0_9TREM